VWLLMLICLWPCHYATHVLLVVWRQLLKAPWNKCSYAYTSVPMLTLVCITAYNCQLMCGLLG
jgi:hypothetical protein